ncbi:MAG: PilZ domain-containing protein [Methylovulum sp.]|nr:PilZ domain-containing protein [Methylovulum sp.]
MTQLQSNRRKHKRVTIEVDYHFFLDGVEYIGKTRNISLSGAFLSKPEPALMPSCISKSGDLKIKINGELLSFKCEVVYAATHDNELFPAGAGVVFFDNDDETGMSLLNLAVAEEMG